MQPWRISVGLSAALIGSGLLLGGSRLEYLAPFWPVILAEHGIPIGRRVDLVERSVRQGEGDPELTDALRRDAEGEWE